jgi:hypothetical protein
MKTMELLMSLIAVLGFMLLGQMYNSIMAYSLSVLFFVAAICWTIEEIKERKLR